MIYVVDAAPGQGKTTAAISFINSSKGKRFLYITEYISEADRIKSACPLKDFRVPSNKLESHKFKKSNHLFALVQEGRNIALTHNLFSRSTPETIALIKERDYTVIIDEVLEVVISAEFRRGDMRDLRKADWLIRHPVSQDVPYEYYEGNMDAPYEGGRFDDVWEIGCIVI